MSPAKVIKKSTSKEARVLSDRKETVIKSKGLSLAQKPVTFVPASKSSGQAVLESAAVLRPHLMSNSNSWLYRTSHFVPAFPAVSFSAVKTPHKSIGISLGGLIPPSCLPLSSEFEQVSFLEVFLHQ